MNKPFTYGSLFSGIGGIDLGLDRAGMQCTWQVEIDDYAQKVLAKHWPDVTRFRDVRTVGQHNLSPVDLICGGFPCQDISNAGKRAGIAGSRSGLWSEYYRIICELRPRYVLVENVSALLGRGIERVLGDLAEGGYDAEWQCLRAADFGAPHLRNRVFIVAYSSRSYGWGAKFRSNSKRHKETSIRGIRDVAHSTGEGLPFRGYPRLATSNTQAITGVEYQSERCGQDVPDPDCQGLAVGQVFGGYAQQKLTAFKRDCSTGSGQWAIEPSICRVANGVPARVDRLKGLGNAVVPQIAEYIGKCILAAEMELTA